MKQATFLARGQVVWVTASVLVLVIFNGCSRSAKPVTKRTVPVLAAQAVEKDVPVQLRTIGNVMPYNTVTVRSQITGQIKGVHFKEGQELHKGDLLYTLDARPPQAALMQAQANMARDRAQMENAKVEFERSQKLFDAKVMAQADFDTARAALDSAQGTVLADQAAITNAELNLAYTSIQAPIDGVAGAQLVYAGNIVKSPDDEMLMINQIHPIYVSFAVPEQYLTEIRAEMSKGSLKVTATFNGINVPPPVGALTFVDNMVDAATGTIALKATFANEDSVLWPGQFVQTELDLKELPKAVVVPSQAVQTGQNGDYVFVIKPDQSVEMRPVKIGPDYQGGIVITEGVKTGETVVTDGQLNLTPGTAISIKSAQDNSEIAGAQSSNEAAAKTDPTNAAPVQP